MFLWNRKIATRRSLLFTCKISYSLLGQCHIKAPFRYSQGNSYVDVYMKWKKDRFYDSLDHIHKSIQLKSILALKNCIEQESNGCIPISAISKRGREFDISVKVARFLREYPSIFEEFTGPQYNIPWFRLTPEAVLISREEKCVHENCNSELQERLKRFILMSRKRVVPLKIIQGMIWYLGLPDVFLQAPEVYLDRSFKLIDMEDGSKGLAVTGNDHNFCTVLQSSAMKSGVYTGRPSEAIEFPLLPSKGLRLKRKIDDWLKYFQKLPYISPYEDVANLDLHSDLAEKRLVGFLHELLCLFVEHSAERKKLLCLKKHFGLPQKMHKAFERHPHIFYLSFRNKTCTAILKEAYSEKSTIPRHPLLSVRNKYIKLMKESELILKARRTSRGLSHPMTSEKDLDLENNDEDDSFIADYSV